MSPDHTSCPTCGLTFPTKTTGGLCPKCLFSNTPIASPEAGAPDEIGPYQIIEPLGEGGMGQVFIAEQIEPIQRRVALKIIKPGMDSSEILSRFEAERQAIALMDHPHIARVFDAGTTDDGRPYFVMELVNGLPLTEFCDTHRLKPAERLSLFQCVCKAVQHAHQKGIIHRDLKPTNILVAGGMDGGPPVPKIIDFGVAKALEPGLTEQTLHTLAGQLIGTPQYMSPEQADLDGRDVDTRSDVYALGILLYEILTGRTPIEKSSLKEAGLGAILRMVREEEFTRPSLFLGSLDRSNQTVIADARDTPPEKLTQIIRGDLDWIVSKALEKERQRRYQSASEFAEDIERYLKHEVVTATPPSPLYLFRKSARRHKVALSTATLVLLVLIGGIATTTWQAREARRQRDLADQTRGAAEGLVTVMLKDLNGKLSSIGRLDLMDDISLAADEYFLQLPEHQVDDQTNALRAQALLNRSYVLQDKGSTEEQITHAREALAIARDLIATDPDNESHLILLTNCHTHLLDHWKLDDAKELVAELLHLSEDLMARDEKRASDYLIATHARINASDHGQDRLEQTHHALRIADDGLAEFPGDPKLLQAKARILQKLARILPSLEEQVESMESAISIYEALAIGDDTVHASWRARYAGLLQQSSWSLHTLGKRRNDEALVEKAVQRQSQALAEQEILVTLSPKNVSRRQQIAIAYHNYGKQLLFKGETTKALALWDLCIAQHEFINKTSSQHLSSVGDCFYQLQTINRHLRNRGDAELKAGISYSQRAFDLLSTLSKEQRNEVIYTHPAYVRSLSYLDKIQEQAGTRPVDLLPRWQAAVDHLEQTQKPNGKTTLNRLEIGLRSCAGIAGSAIAGGRKDEGLKWLERAEAQLTIISSSTGPDTDIRKWNSIYGELARELGELYQRCGEPEKAKAVLKHVKSPP